ncbi:MAG: hypothetical protein K5978_06115 [Campylobacter sp.]|nr:hypothetical protein [Campylobacter sp.]
MIDDLLDNEKFALLMKMHIYECIDFLLQNNFDFAIVANYEAVKFQPELPEDISKNFAKVIVFMLGGYTLQSANLTQDELSFEAGFGEENYASLVSMPLSSIIQILVDDTAVLINFARPIIKTQTQNSMSIFKSNPKNKEIFERK